MALTRSGRSVFFSPGTFGGQFQRQYGNYIKGGLNNRFAGGFDAKFGAYNNGALAPSAFILPLKSGSISSYTSARAELSRTDSTLVPTLPMVVNGTFTLTVTNAQLDQVLQLIASGVLSLTGSANLAAAVAAEASGAMTLAASALLGGSIPIEATGSAALSPGVTLIARAFMEAEAGGPEALSPEGLANAVLDALLADHNEAGTVGEALNNVGAGGNPWASDLSANNNPGSFGERVQKLLTTAKFLGLK